MGLHADARIDAALGFFDVFGVEPTQDEVQPLQGVGWLETRCLAWGKAGQLSFNMGADQFGHPPCNPDKSFEYVDTHPLPDGTSETYRICFRKYKNKRAGWGGLADVMYRQHDRHVVLEAARSGDIYAVSRTMRETGYYEGYGKTQEERIAHHFKALRDAIIREARELGETLPGGEALPPRTLSLKTPRMMGEDVRLVQGIVGAKQDGVFGPKTKKLVRAWQAGHPGLQADGIVGPMTWHALQTAITEIAA